MRFAAELIPATLKRRYKRFLADVELDDGRIITAHVANPGAMTGLQAPGARVWLSRSPSTTRKLPYSWELIEADFGAGRPADASPLELRLRPLPEEDNADYAWVDPTPDRAARTWRNSRPAKS